MPGHCGDVIIIKTLNRISLASLRFIANLYTFPFYLLLLSL